MSSEIEATLAYQLRVVGISFDAQYHAIPGRKFAWDFRIGNLLIECQGGTWSKTRSGHSTGSGIKRDCVKMNLAAEYGYRTLAFTSDMITSGEAVKIIERVLSKLHIPY
jgi:hypothetical protein